MLVCKRQKVFSLTTWIPANTSTLNQRWNNVNRQRSSTKMKMKMKVQQRWNNVDRITSIQGRWTNVVSTLKFGWKWKLSQRMFIDVVSTLTKQRWNYVDRVTLTQCWWPNVFFNVGIRLKRKVESTHIHRCWENSIEPTLSIFFVLRFTRKWLNNKAKLSFQV